MFYIGLDIGSVSCNAVVTTTAGALVTARYERLYGRPVETVSRVLKALFSSFSRDRVAGIAVTGSGGSLVAEQLGCFFVNEIIAQSIATVTLYPHVRTVIEIGGEDAKLILFEKEPASGAVRMRDFAMNTVCAAGTGSFLDQQASRLGVAIEEEFARKALASEHPPRIAGRCSVFAKSDMIHLQQVATPDTDILMGLCLAMARNFKSTVVRAAEMEMPIAFQGGVAANRGMVRAFETVLNLKPGELFVPEHFAEMGAVGAVLEMMQRGAATEVRGPEALDAYLTTRRVEVRHHAVLEDDGHTHLVVPSQVSADSTAEGWLGVDVGSISTNLVVIDSSRRVLARRYLMTAGRPIEAVRRGLAEIGKELGAQICIQGTAVTGSGRYLIGDVIGADQVKNEITAHARGAAGINPAVDTIFEIGGQDSKYIRLENGAVVDFTMNKVCAAGTGSFLEEQAEKLGISIKDEFSALAFASRAPLSLGERCTVFMESSLTHQQQQGAARQDLVAGLSYSIVLNYLNRVVEDRPVGDTVFFQGGTAYNRAVKAAFEQVLGKKVIVPPHHDVLGALGAAIIALELSPDGPSRFKGFDLIDRPYGVDSFECSDCPNACEIRKVSIEGRRPLHYGSRCGKFDDNHKPAVTADGSCLFTEREQLLRQPHAPAQSLPDTAPRVGLPRSVFYYEMYPFWSAFFAELGLRLVASPVTNQAIANRGCEAVVEEICFPVKVAHGHVLQLLEQDLDYILLPCVVNMEPLSPEADTAYNCPYVQSLPFLLDAAVDFSRYTVKVLRPVVHLEWGVRVYGPQLRELARQVGCRGRRVERAIEAACSALKRFRGSLVARGREVLDGLSAERPAVVLVSRPYNGCDPGLNFRIPDKLRDMGVVALPLDFLPVEHGVGEAMQSMYWRYGQRIISAARTIVRDPRLHAVYMTNFGCGPDSFIAKYFSREMRGKPFLTLEVDEHSADAGVITRLEAFFDSIQGKPVTGAAEPCQPVRPQAPRSTPAKQRKIYVPYMDDHGLAFAAAMRFNGLDAEALPMADAESVAIGRRYTSGKECYPCIITTGDIVRKAQAPDFNPARASFFMPSAMGPCRFGQYNRFHRQVLDELGLDEVPMVLLDQTTGYDEDLGRLGNGFRLLGWQSVILIDYLKKMLLQTRPYEKTRGDADREYAACLGRLLSSIEQYGSIGDCPQDAARRFEALATGGRGAKPLIGIVGEIYVRSNQFSNNFFIRQIEALGGEVVVPTLQEWVAYTDTERRKDQRRSGTFKSYLAERLKKQVQDHYVRKISRPFQGQVKHFFRELETDDVMRLCRPYCVEHIRGEANLSMGRAVEYARHGMHGVANLIPFNCMPGTIVNTLLWRFAGDYPQLPLLKMVYDGTEQAGDRTRIEAFMYQARQALEAGRK